MQEEERRDEIDALLRSADETDVAEDVRLGPEVRGDELPAELRRREDRLAAIRAAKARCAAGGGRRAGPAAGADPEPEGRPAVQAGVSEEKAQSNFTDPESGIMKTSNTAVLRRVDAGTGRCDGERERPRRVRCC